MTRVSAARGTEAEPWAVAVVVGTRPEALKLAPLIRCLRQRSSRFTPVVIATAQHREMLDQVLSLFDITADIDLDLMRPDQTLGTLTEGVLHAMGGALAKLNPRLVVVQGDTTTAFTAALAAFYARIPVAHVEAGLRSGDPANPFPEEINRRLTAVLTELHFAPTPLARRRLRREGVPARKIAVTGNTIVDTLGSLLTSGGVPTTGRTRSVDLGLNGHRLLVVTSHRRESWGRELENICRAIRELVVRFPDLVVVYPVHLNPNVRDTVHRMLQDVERVRLIPPLDYAAFVELMHRAYVILTDSGGIQEEGPTLRKPLLVLRKVTERPEAFRAGLARLVGTDAPSIVAAVSRLLTDPVAYRSMTADANPYGDGQAAERIVEALTRWSRGLRPLLPREREFRPPSLVAS
jgi:UDP-N-acetylglucosamine 2-epimerase (non-hydrolysing)